MKPGYTARAARIGRSWAIHIRELPHVQTRSRRLDQAEAAAREAIALALDAPEDSFQVVVQPDRASLGALLTVLDEALAARDAADHSGKIRAEAD